MSPYNYCAGNPVKLVDPTGMNWFVAEPTEGSNGSYIYLDDSYNDTNVYTDEDGTNWYNLGENYETPGDDFIISGEGYSESSNGNYSNYNYSYSKSGNNTSYQSEINTGNIFGNTDINLTIPNGEVGTSLGAYKQDNTFNALNIGLGSFNASISLQEELMNAAGQNISNFGKCGRLMSVGGKALGTVGVGFSTYSAIQTIDSGNNRGWLDLGMTIAGAAAPLAVGLGLISNPVGWTIVGVSAVYGISTAIYDYNMNK